MFISRFAPSPTGLLHLGHAYSALLTQNLVTRNSGTLHLRIEDIDITRCTPDFEKQIYRDLEWLGVQWDSTPLRQSEELSIYINSLKQLVDKGLVYGCDCTRSDIKKALSAPNNLANDASTVVYPGTCREKNLSLDGRNVRLNLLKSKNYLETEYINFFEQGIGPNKENGDQTFDIAWLEKRYGDFIIARKDVRTSYHLAVTVDDAQQKVTHVSRGNDLFYVTPIHVILQNLLNFKTPVYIHHPLIKDKNGNKLAKSKGAESILSMRNSGTTIKEIRSFLGL
mgnify:FL=1